MYTLHVLINISLRSTRICDIYCNQILNFKIHLNAKNIYFTEIVHVLIPQSNKRIVM